MSSYQKDPRDAALASSHLQREGTRRRHDVVEERVAIEPVGVVVRCPCEGNPVLRLGLPCLSITHVWDRTGSSHHRQLR